MALEVIGTGFGRTGTDNPLMKARWREFMNSDVPDWPALFEGYRSCVDWPSAHYWRELVPLYPQARVILTWRDPESWWTSFEATILRYVQSAQDRESVGVRIIEKAFGDRANDRAQMIAAYEANVAAVIAMVPKSRLLVHNPGDGWEPLCAHLGVPVPEIPYPSRNTTAELQKRAGLQRPPS